MRQAGEIEEPSSFITPKIQGISPAPHSLFTQRQPFCRTDRRHRQTEFASETADREPALAQKRIEIIAKGRLGMSRHPANLAEYRPLA